jgi:hypothetical protein
MRSYALEATPFTRYITDFNTLNRFYSSKLGFALRPLRLDSTSLHAPAFRTDTFFSDSAGLSLANFNQFNTLAGLDFIEDSYENLKSADIFSPAYLKTFFHLKNSSLPSVSYATNLNMFRADFEESVWTTDEVSSSHLENTAQHNAQVLLTNPLKLRSTVKNLMVTYSAIQKVYRSRFDEGRSNMNTSALFNSYSSYPFLTEGRANYESVMGKNKEAYFAPSLFTSHITNKLSDLGSSFASNTSLFLDIPFLLSLKSDPSRYLWFD